MRDLITKFIEDDSGATAIEYGLIAALIATGMIAGVTSLGNSVGDKYDDVGTTLTGVSDTAGTTITDTD